MSSVQDGSMPFLDLYSSEFQTRPHEVLRTFREQHFCANTAMGIIVLRYAEAQELLAHRLFRTPSTELLAMQGVTAGPMVDLMSTLLLNSHGETHDRLRRLVSRAFAMRSVDGFRTRIAEIAAELVQSIAQRDHCDFMADFAEPFAGRVLFEFVGIPLSAMEKIAAWNADIVLMFGFEAAKNAARIEATLREVGDFVDELAETRRRAPRADLISALVTAEESDNLLSPAELRAMLVTLLSAGTGTVSRQLGNGIATFSQHPAQWQALAADPNLAAPAVEEIFRYSTAVVLGLPRIATEDVAWHGLRVPRGAFMLPIPGAANRDPAVFTDPERFDITQTRRPHLTLGSGSVHFCLGAALGRAELQAALIKLSQTLRELRCEPGARLVPPTEFIYGPLSLPISYRA
jgi:cytochrome P450